MRVRRMLFFGSLVEPEAVPRYPQVSAGSNVTQMTLLCELLNRGVERVTAVTQLAVEAGWLGGKAGVRGQRWRLAQGLDVIAPGFPNVPLVKPFAAHARLFRVGMRVASMVRPDIVMCYNTTPGYASAGLAVARQLGVPFVPQVADLTPSGGWSKPWRAAQSAWSHRIVLASDGLIAYSGHVARDLAFPGPWIKMDGILANDWDKPLAVVPRTKTVVYSGTASPATGIRLVLSAFAQVPDPEMRLVITGRGPLAHEVQQAARTDPRIRAAGLLDRRRMQGTLASATVLINPRPSRLPENRYNFPGKLLDYMASGRPAITTLAGDLDDEYRSLTIPLTEETPEALAALIVQTCARPPRELTDLGARAREFVLRTRSAGVQTARVLGFLEALA